VQPDAGPVVGASPRGVRPLAVMALAMTLLLGLLAPTNPAVAVDPTPTPLVSGWLPSWATDTALAGVVGNADLVGEASPFWYTAKASGGAVTLSTTMGPDTVAGVLDGLRAKGIAVIPSVADGSAAKAMAAVLADPAARAAHVNQLVELVTVNGFDGIELDYEKFAFSDGTSTWATTRPAWVAFVTELGTALHGAGKRLALAVPPMYDGTYTSSSGYWVYDYAGVAPVVDSLRIMTYDYSVSRPGPISPLSFIRRTLAYAVTAFPAARIRMGPPAYGRLWTARRADGSRSITGTCPTTPAVPGTTSFTTATAMTYLTSVAGVAPTLRYDDASGETVATFAKEYAGVDAAGTATSCVVDHEAWWVDSRGVAARMPLVTEYGVAGVAAWRLGGVDPDSWTAMRSFASGIPFVAPTPIAPPVVTTVVAAAPSTLTPKRGKKVRVRVQVTPGTKSVTVRRQMLVKGKWKTRATKRTSSAGRVTFTFRWPKSKTSRTYRITTKKKGSLPAGRSEQFTLTTR
jgi:spore germination protein YaaH